MYKFNDYFNAKNSTIRLFNDYEKHGNLIVAFDFDDTIFNYHGTADRTFFDVIHLLQECSALGFTMVLFTANEDEDKLNFCRTYCRSNEIRIDYINESPVMNTRKPYYNILLDDRAGLEEAYGILKFVVEMIKERQNADH